MYKCFIFEKYNIIMKNFITVICLITGLFGFSQSKIDTLVFNKLNEYRSSLCYLKSSEIKSQHKFKSNKLYITKIYGKRSKSKVDTIDVSTIVIVNVYDSDFKKFRDTIFYFPISKKDIVGGRKLDSLKFDNILYKASENHTSFLIDTNKILIKKGLMFATHEQPKKEFKTSSDRYKYYGGNGSTLENAQIGDSKNLKDLSDENLEVIAIGIISNWKISKLHNENMINIDVNSTAVCVKFIQSKSGLVNVINYKSISTMMFIKK